MSILSRGSTVRDYRERLKYLYWIILGSFLLILSRFWYLQLFKGNLFLEYSTENRIRSAVVPAPRGMIYDKEGRVLVDNLPSFDVTLTPQYIQRDMKALTLKKVASIINVTEKSIKDKLKKAEGQPRFLPVVLKEDISRDEHYLIELGAIFGWHIGIETTNGTVKRTSFFRFRRLPIWKKSDFKNAKLFQEKIRRLING